MTPANPEFPLLDTRALDGIADLCGRAIPGGPDRAELEAALFCADQPAIVHGDPDIAVVATVRGPGGVFIRLLAVDPSHRGKGIGHRLIESAETDARALGETRLTVGADAPFFLWPGVPSTATDMLCLLERHHYTRSDTNFDMTIDLATIPVDSGGGGSTLASDRSEVDEWAGKHWPNWQSEILRAHDKGNLMISRDDRGISAFCAFEVNRAGYLGPVAVRPDLIGRGVGRSALLGALHELRRRGRSHIDVVWVGPVVPYARMGARVSSVYFVYQRELA